MADFAVVELKADPPRPKAEDKVTLTAKVKRTDAGTDAVALNVFWKLGSDKLQGANEETTQVPKDGEVSLTHEIPKFTKDHAGKYSVGAKSGAADQALTGTNELELTAPAEAPGGQGDGPAPAADPRDLVWDPQFAWLTGIFGILMVIFVSVMAGIWMLDAAWEDLTGYFVVGAVWAGTVVILAGVWIVALEMRGRAPTTVGEQQDASLPTKGLLKDLLGKFDISEIGATLRSMRGVLAVLFVGLLLFVAAMVAIELAEDEGGNGDDTSSGDTTGFVTLVV